MKSSIRNFSSRFSRAEKLSKKVMVSTGFSAFLFFASFSSGAEVDKTADVENKQSEQFVSYKHFGSKYPPVLFVTNIDDVPVKETLESYDAFSRLDTEAVGLPIGVRVVKGHRTKQDGTQFSTLMLSASTLGIIPIVSNTEFKVYYDVFVQGKSIKQFKYQVDSTDVDNLWSAPYGDREVKPSEAKFIEYTLPKFMSELRESEEVQLVFEEYREYFGED